MGRATSSVAARGKWTALPCWIFFSWSHQVLQVHVLVDPREMPEAGALQICRRLGIMHYQISSVLLRVLLHLSWSFLFWRKTETHLTEVGNTLGSRRINVFPWRPKKLYRDVLPGLLNSRVILRWFYLGWKQSHLHIMVSSCHLFHWPTKSPQRITTLWVFGLMLHPERSKFLSLERKLSMKL